MYCRCDLTNTGLEEEYRFLRVPEKGPSTVDWRGEGYVLDEHLVERIRRGELPPPPKVMLQTPSPGSESVLTELRCRFAQRLYVTWADPRMLEIMPAGVDKGVALERLARQLQVPLGETLALGDGHNDLPMLRCAGKAAVMGNAAPEVRAAALDAGAKLAPSLAQQGFIRAILAHVPGRDERGP